MGDIHRSRTLRCGFPIAGNFTGFIGIANRLAAKMQIVPLICPHCGADLDVPEEATVLRCTYCASKLAVVASSNTRALKLIGDGIEEILQHSRRTSEGMEALAASQEAMLQSRHDARKRWLNEKGELVDKIHHCRGQALKYTALTTLCIFVFGMGGSLLLVWLAARTLGGHCFWPLVIGIVLGFFFANRQVIYAAEKKRLIEKLGRWDEREPLP